MISSESPNPGVEGLSAFDWTEEEISASAWKAQTLWPAKNMKEVWAWQKIKILEASERITIASNYDLFGFFKREILLN